MLVTHVVPKATSHQIKTDDSGPLLIMKQHTMPYTTVECAAAVQGLLT